MQTLRATLRAEHIGSFLRPKDLIAAWGGDPAKLREIEDRHILRVLAKQKELGYKVFTDGELRRSTFMSDFLDAVDGFDRDDAVDRTWKKGQSEMPQIRVSGIVDSKLKQVRKLTEHELPFLQQHSPGPIKMTLPSATQFPAISYKKGISDKAYPTRSALLADITGIIRDECAWLSTQDKVAYIQIDAPRYSYYVDPKWRDWLKQEMEAEPEQLLDEALAADNACFRAARKAGLTLAIHLCRGNNRSHWYAQGGYDAIAEKLFTTLDCDRFLLEYDDERSGTFEPLRFIPKDKDVVLGLISSKLAPLEKADDIAKAIEQAAKFVPLDRLALSPQCGFASTMEGNMLTEDEQWAKLKLVVDVARKVWGEA